MDIITENTVHLADRGIKGNTSQERRRLQNRLNQRAYKLRKRQLQQLEAVREGGKQRPDSQPGFGMLVPNNTVVPGSESRLKYPLPADHLLSLIHFNVWRALIANSFSMNLSHVFPTKESVGSYITPFISPKNIPQSLIPTKLQLAVPHEPSIDFFPLPRLRDNMIILGNDLFTMGSFCRDMLGALFKNHNVRDSGQKCMIVWGDPWDVNSWECTPGFLREWGWLLDGCEELINSTNRWRINRGEVPIFNTSMEAT